MRLYLPFTVHRDLFMGQRNKNVCTFLNFLRSETNWKIKSFTIQCGLLEVEELLPFFLQNEELCLTSVKKMQLVYAGRACNEKRFDTLFIWLEKVVLDNRAKVIVIFSREIFPVPIPKIVSKLKRETSYWNGHEIGVENIPSYCNLTSLLLDNVGLDIETLSNFTCLKKLSVGSLNASVVINASKLSILPTVKVLKINILKTYDAELLPLIMKKCFPCLTSFEIFKPGIDDEFLKMGLILLPRSCTFLKTDISLLPFFAKCTCIQNLSVLNERMGSLEIIDKIFNNVEFRMLCLEFRFRSSLITLSCLMNQVVHFVWSHNFLEILIFRSCGPIRDLCAKKNCSMETQISM